MIGKTLGIYIGSRFAKSCLVAFATIFTLVYIIDLVELLRRSGETTKASASFLAFLSLIRVPAIVEQVLPFVILIGAMAAFLNLTRKLELVVARASGISVWQFLFPPVLVALSIGIFATTVYNPVSALLKERADHIEAGLFTKFSPSGPDTSLWIRQRSGDGQAIIRAEKASESGRKLSNVTAFVFDVKGVFQERIEANEAQLNPGFWLLSGTRVLRVGEPPEAAGNYNLSTNLTAAQVTQSFIAPDAVPFWELPSLSARMQEAGLNSTRYRLRFQTLLARPLLLVAMVLVAASFSLRFFRMGGVSRMVSGGVAAGFVLYVVQKLVGDLGGAGVLNTALAAWTPAIIGVLFGALMLLHQEDG